MSLLDIVQSGWLWEWAEFSHPGCSQQEELLDDNLLITVLQLNLVHCIGNLMITVGQHTLGQNCALCLEYHPWPLGHCFSINTDHPAAAVE